MTKHRHKMGKWRWNGAQAARRCVRWHTNPNIPCPYEEYVNVDALLRILNRYERMKRVRYRKVGHVSNLAFPVGDQCSTEVQVGTELYIRTTKGAKK